VIKPLPEAQATFEASVDATVGIEEEFALLDPATLDLAPRYEELHALALQDPVLRGSVAGELISSEIEIRSGRGETFAAALTQQREARGRLFALADAHDAALGATGTHPWADYREQPNIDTEHYRRVVEGLQWVARRNNTFSLHVHVGIQGADRAVQVCDRLRPVLPALLSLSANSTWLDARDAGLHSARTQSFTKVFPRCGVPDAFGSWAAYADYIAFLQQTNSIVEYTQVWWSVRPHFDFGTVEVRICDVQGTAAESDALSALITACVLQAAADIDEGRPWVDPPRRLIEENFWRAIRFGQDGLQIDLATATEHPAAEARDRLLEWTAPARAAHDLPEPAFPLRNGAQRQRRALDAGATLAEVYSAAVRETHSTYSDQEATTP
jgi:glutamate---cysteine ligase / carboxylate-amine ligase